MPIMYAAESRPKAVERQAFALEAQPIGGDAVQHELGDVVPVLKSLPHEPISLGDAERMDVELDLAVFTDPGLEAQRHRPVAIAESAAEPLKAAQIVLARLAGPSGAA